MSLISILYHTTDNFAKSDVTVKFKGIMLFLAVCPQNDKDLEKLVMCKTFYHLNSFPVCIT
jgi:hypothetical protein